VRIAQRIAFTVICRPSAAAAASPRRNPRRHRIDDRLECEPLLLVEFGRESDLGVDDAVVGEVDDRLVGDAFDVVCGLHHRQRVLEGREVLQQVGGLGTAREPRLKLVGVGGRQRPADRLGQFHDRRHTEPAVEVVVQENLRQAAGVVERDRHGRAPTACP
jgi:hypothetical protein